MKDQAEREEQSLAIGMAMLIFLVAMVVDGLAVWLLDLAGLDLTGHVWPAISLPAAVIALTFLALQSRERR